MKTEHEPTITILRLAIVRLLQLCNDKCRDCALHYGQAGGICEVEKCPLHNFRGKIEDAGVPMVWLETGRMRG